VPVLQQLWLATDRNYLCVRERIASQTMYGGLPTNEMHVDDLREIAPGRWLPMKTIVDHYDLEALRQKNQRIDRRTVIVVEKADLAPRHGAAFSRDVAIPAGLPVFTIRDGKLVGSSLPEPIRDETQEKVRLAEIVARVHQEEQRYNDLEVKAHVDYK